jgi:hypothetical protein
MDLTPCQPHPTHHSMHSHLLPRGPATFLQFSYSCASWETLLALPKTFTLVFSGWFCLNVFPKSSCVRNLIPKFICWWHVSVGLWEVIRVRWGTEDGVPAIALVALEEEDRPKLAHLLSCHRMLSTVLWCSKKSSRHASIMYLDFPDSRTMNQINLFSL